MKLWSVIFVWILFITSPVFSSDLDSIYLPLLSKDQQIYEIDTSYFELTEEGVSGSANFGNLKSNPNFLTLSHGVKFSLSDNIETVLNFNETFPNSYERATNNPDDVLASLQEYRLNYFHEAGWKLRFRQEPLEWYFDLSQKR